MSNSKNDNEGVSENACEHKEKSVTTTTIVQESSFVTPGIFRRRKVPKQGKDEGGANEAKENSENFKWSIDQLSKIRPMQFDETEEFSLPPEDWDPVAKFSCPQFENVEHFWTQNTFIAPSPEVFAATASRFMHSNTPFDSPHFALSPMGSGPSSSSKCSLSNAAFVSPTMMLTYSQLSQSVKLGLKDTEENNATTSAHTGDIKEMQQVIADGSDDFEQLERSLSFEVADCIVADMDDGEGFVFMEMRKEGPSVDPIEEGGH